MENGKRTQSVDEEVVLYFVNVSRKSWIQQWEIDFHGFLQEIHLPALQTLIAELIQDVMGTRPGLKKRKKLFGR